MERAEGIIVDVLQSGIEEEGINDESGLSISKG